MTALTGLNLETAEDFQVIPSLFLSFPCFSSVAIKQDVLQQNYYSKPGRRWGLNGEEAYFKYYGIKKLNDKLNDHSYMK